MDANQFDELIARLAEGPSRRDALKGLVGGALATVGIGAAIDDSDAKGNGKGKGKGKGRKNNGRGAAQRASDDVTDEGKKNKNKCGRGKKRCGGNCRSINTNKRCGGCNISCDADQQCIDRVCVAVT